MSRSLSLAAATRRLARWPRLVTIVLRLPRFLPAPLRSSLYRSFSWPLAKIWRTEAVIPVKGGSRMRVSSADQIGRVLMISGVWEPNVTAAFTRSLHGGDVCLDIGAHIGYFTLLASRLVGPEGHVYAFEPWPSNYGSLRENLARNGVENVTAIASAVGDATERALLHAAPGTNTGRATLRETRPNRAPITQEGVIVDVQPATTRIPEHDWPRIRVIKIDVEGYELEVLRSLAPLFALGKPLSVFVEFNPGWSGDADAASQLEELCRSHGFTLQRLSAGYALETLFPAHVDAPVRIDEVPPHECDLLLTR